MRPPLVHRLSPGTTTTMVAARRSMSRGTPWGNRALARGVPPGQQSVEGSSHLASGDSRASGAEDNRLSPRRLQAVVVGRRSMPPAWWRHCRSGRQPQSCGVSDHPKWPLGLPSPRPRTWSLNATLKDCWRPVSAAVGPLEAAKNPVVDLSKNLMNFAAVFSQWPQHLD